VIPALAGTKTTGLRIALFSSFVGLGPPDLKAATARHLELYLEMLSELPLGKQSHLGLPTHEEHMRHAPPGDARGPRGAREALAPRVMSFIAAAEDDDLSWLPLEVATEMVKKHMRAHPRFNFAPVLVLLQRFYLSPKP
jgi:hypothetical protein